MLQQQGFSKVLILIIVLAVIAGGVLAWQYWPEGVEEEEQPADETVDWQTYRNEEYGFEMKYPEDWTVEENGKGVAFWTPSTEECISTGGWECDLGVPRVAIYNPASELYGNDQLTFEEWFEERKSVGLFGDRENIKIGEYDGFDIVESGMIGYRTIFLFGNAKIARFSIDDKSDFMDEFDQMLSTFKFID